MENDIIKRLKWNLAYDEETLLCRGLGIYPSTNIELLRKIIDRFEKSKEE